MLLMIEKVIILKSVNLFSKIPESTLLSIATQLREVQYDEGQTIITQGDLGTSMYILVRGTVEVIIDGHVIATQREIDIFGELAALDPEPRSATIKTTQETLVFEISSTLIYNLISEYPSVARGIIKILCNRIRDNNKH
ncbi:MAG: cyclic nucleotide-binding domain-containing protein [Epsilonproteobacteria bacterium]|nr:MAG: cyclic nucleotide-binding domain-containing protein [Campylobacterota bacterium]